MKKLRVAELFAGVGGFRLGLEGWKGKSPSSNYKEVFSSPYEVLWSNQWEPSTKTQHASLVYENRFGSACHCNEDIEQVKTKDIPDHDLLVGGFPCQDYSVATTLKNSKGLLGKKGVLWWSIYRILDEKKKKPKYLFLENVDRLLSSPAKQRGRDFAVILKSLSELGYAVEWRVINAADYGMPQRRRRTFILGYFKGTKPYKELKRDGPEVWTLTDGILAEAFPVGRAQNSFISFDLDGDVATISSNFNKHGALTPFQNSGVMLNGRVHTIRTVPNYEGKHTLLRDVLQKETVSEEYYISPKELVKWEYLKGSKKEIRTNKEGFEYNYSEGGLAFPDPLDKPSRTIITGEGGASPSRFKHVVSVNGRFRRLTPIELERLNMFPDNHTNLDGISDAKRAFFMGNALVVGVIEKIGLVLADRIQ